MERTTEDAAPVLGAVAPVLPMPPQVAPNPRAPMALAAGGLDLRKARWDFVKHLAKPTHVFTKFHICCLLCHQNKHQPT